VLGLRVRHADEEQLGNRTVLIHVEVSIVSEVSVVKDERVEMSAVSTVKDEHDEANAVILWWRNAAQRVCTIETVDFPHGQLDEGLSVAMDFHIWLRVEGNRVVHSSTVAHTPSVHTHHRR